MNNREKIPSLENNEKQKRWEEEIDRLGQTVDKLGKSIDSNIKEAVASLNLLGIYTTASCEGHLDHGTRAPWVDIESKETETLNEQLKKLDSDFKKGETNFTLEEAKEKAQVILRDIERKNLEERKKIISYLDEFYKNRHVPFHVRLITEGLARGWTRLESQGVDLQKIENDEIKQQRLTEYQDEMKVFTEFLKEKYFGEKE